MIVISAPSGAGKTTLVREMIGRRPEELVFSVSYTTRPPRRKEVDGVDYFFVSEEKFRAMVSADAFLESARVFGHRYGTSREYVEGLREAGKTVLLEIDWQGAEQIRSREPAAVSVFVLPPGREVLEQRLKGRGTDSMANIDRRLREALTDMAQWERFDYVLVNDHLDTAADEFEAILDGRGAAHRADSRRVRRDAARIAGSCCR